MKNIKILLFTLLASGFALQSCASDDDNNGTIEETGSYKDGIFVLNEGAMGSNNAEVTFFKNGNVTQNLFKTVNPTLNLGNVATSILFEDNDAYIVVNMSNKIEVVHATTFESKGTISSNVNNPRYIAADDQKIYVTNWADASNPNDDFISVFRRSDLAFEKKIDVVEGPDQILIENNKLVIAHSGGWSNGNSVSIYNLATNTLENITVGDVPSAMVEEDGIVYVLCSGVTWGGTPSAGKLVKINLNSNAVAQTINFQEGQNPKFLVEDNNQLYYTLNNQVFRVGTQDIALPSTALFTHNATYTYSFNVLNGAIYIGDAKDFASNGEVKYYSLNGTLLGNFSTGIGPNFITPN